MLLLVTVALVVVATLARVHDETKKIAFNYGFDVALAATYYLDVVALELILGALAHVASKHHLDAHLLHH